MAARQSTGVVTAVGAIHYPHSGRLWLRALAALVASLSLQWAPAARAAEIGQYCQGGSRAPRMDGSTDGDAKLSSAAAIAERDLQAGQGQAEAADAVFAALAAVAAENPQAGP